MKHNQNQNMYTHFSPKTDPRIDFERSSPEALQMLDNARSIAGIPFRITSNVRQGKNQGAHGEIPCTAFDIGYRHHQQTRDWVEQFRRYYPGTFAKGRGKQTYEALELYFDNVIWQETLPDAIRIIVALMKAGFPRIGIQLGPGNEHCHVDASPELTQKYGKVVFVE